MHWAILKFQKEIMNLIFQRSLLIYVYEGFLGNERVFEAFYES